MKARNALLFIATALGFACAQATPAVQATLTLGNNAQSIAIDPALAKAYVTNLDDDTVSIIDINALTVVATLNVAPMPRRIIADAATHRVYLTNSIAPGTVTVIDGTTNSIVTTIPVGNNPRGLGSNFLIGQIYVSNLADNTVSVISTATNSVVATIPVGKSPDGPSSNDILQTLYIPSFADNTVSVIDEQTLTLLATIPVGRGPGNAAIDGVHNKVYVNNETDNTVSVISSATNTVIATVPSGRGGTGNTSNFVTFNAAYRKAYLANAVDGTVTIIDTDTDTVENTVTVGPTPVAQLVDPNGGNVYVLNQGNNSVSILAAGTETVVDSLAVGVLPTAMGNALNHLFVLNSNGPSVDSLTIAADEDTLAQTAIANEFYEANFNHYFHTADEVEFQLLADGIFGDAWQRTFELWRVWTAPGPGRVPVCRFFSTSFRREELALLHSVRRRVPGAADQSGAVERLAAGKPRRCTTLR